jgi:hypothetical protein
MVISTDVPEYLYASPLSFNHIQEENNAIIWSVNVYLMSAVTLTVDPTGKK